ncbi:MAG TPA: sigma-E factor regulatory protein RseB domain-containing protein [Desulfobacterales bacterium]|nr:sigma-E factor regulatory protein RseB domain-containing protein [Desulfobacterales bacterium]
MAHPRPPALLTAALLAAAFAGPAHAAPDARAARLLKAALSGPSAACTGEQTIEVFVDSSPLTARVRLHANGQGAVRREFGAGAAGVVTLQTGRTVYRRDPAGRWTRLPTSGAETAAADAILANYAVSVQDGGTVAGRKAALVVVRARQPFNPSRRLWVDSPTGLVLRDVLYAPDGRIRSRSEFISLRFGPQPSALFAPPATAAESAAVGPASFEALRSPAHVLQETGRAILAPTYLPPGYRPVLFGAVTARSGLRFPAVRYSDGLASFTVFQRGWGGPGGGMGRGMGGGFGGGPGRHGRGWGQAGPPPGRGRRAGAGPGADAGLCALRTTRQQVVVERATERASYVLVGDLAEAELRRVANSLP